MVQRKKRVPIEKAVAARVLFLADRTCCVCRQQGKQVQIHHIDDDPSNNTESNLAVLCFDCHHLTQITGGFGRRLDADQVVLYRDAWSLAVKRQRGEAGQHSDEATSPAVQLELATSIAEIYRESGDFVSLAMHYGAIGNDALRDKYVDEAIKEGVDEPTLIFLRGALQGRPDLIPDDVARLVLDHRESVEDWSQRARTLVELHRWPEAVTDYCRSIMRSLEQGNTFSAAYYLKELCREGLNDELFLIAYAEADDLWWKIRALQELEDEDGLRELLREHEAEIRASENLLVLPILEQYLGTDRAYVEARKREVASEVDLGGGIVGHIVGDEATPEEPRGD